MLIASHTEAQTCLQRLKQRHFALLDITRLSHFDKSPSITSKVDFMIKEAVFFFSQQSLPQAMVQTFFLRLKVALSHD